jgi:hypothetical protein
MDGTNNNQTYYERNREARIAYQRTHYRENIERIRTRNRQRYYEKLARISIPEARIPIG